MSDMKKVWRVENSRGVGMYNWGTTALKYMGVGKRHPGPSSGCLNPDCGISQFFDYIHPTKEVLNWKFGFASLEQAKRWIYSAKIRRLLRNEGHLLNCYEVPKDSFHKSYHQTIFDSSKAKLIESRHVTFWDER
jgi:hypothetical protein